MDFFLLGFLWISISRWGKLNPQTLRFPCTLGCKTGIWTYIFIPNLKLHILIYFFREVKTWKHITQLFYNYWMPRCFKTETQHWEFANQHFKVSAFQTENSVQWLYASFSFPVCQRILICSNVMYNNYYSFKLYILEFMEPNLTTTMLIIVHE